MIGDFATAGAGASASGTGTLSMARVDAPRRAAPLPHLPPTALTHVAHGSPDGPIGVRMFYVLCWVIYAGTAVQWLAGH